MFSCQSGRGAARLARLHGVQEVGGSNPLAPTDKDKAAVQLRSIPAGLPPYLLDNIRNNEGWQFHPQIMQIPPIFSSICAICYVCGLF